MKIALLGNGKTGSRVYRLAVERGDEVSVFDSKYVPTLNRLQGNDVIICFLTGDAFLEYHRVILNSRIPLILGSTGFEWPMGIEQLDKQANDLELIMVQSGNFSLGNLAILPLLDQLGKNPVLQEFKPLIHEWHHIHKKDAPSGTAKMWSTTFGRQTEVESYREGDIVGIHEITLSTSSEKITLRHEVTDRDVFARGALFLADFVIRNRDFIRSGLYGMQQLMDTYKHLH